MKQHFLEFIRSIFYLARWTTGIVSLPIPAGWENCNLPLIVVTLKADLSHFDK